MRVQVIVHVHSSFSDVTGLYQAHDAEKILACFRAHQSQIPIILITAFGDDEFQAEARNFGVTAIVDKPFDIEEFCQYIDSLCSDGCINFRSNC